jgi:CRISPR-associated protein Csb2
MRLAAMAKFGWEIVGGRRRPRAPSVISGYGEDGKPMHDDSHAHAFWLPEDADGDGEIDHIIIYAAAGLNEECRQKLDRITRLWLEKPVKTQGSDEESAEVGRKEWRLALEGFGNPTDFASASSVLARCRRWLSVTPYLMPWHTKKGFDWTDQIAREVKARDLSRISETPHEHRSLSIRDRNKRPIEFHRFRSRGGLTQPDTLGRFVELAFDRPVQGPLAFGFGCHFGLGLFAATHDSQL